MVAYINALSRLAQWRERLLGTVGTHLNTAIDQFFEAGRVFEDSLGKDRILFLHMAVGEIF